MLRANGIADLPGSRVLIGYQLIKYVISCFFGLAQGRKLRDTYWDFIPGLKS